jgi:ABC-type transport system involved in cytochrome c biogenesis ATPase subunit
MSEVAVLFSAERLRLGETELSLQLRPGLTFVRGGEGRGKTRLLQLIAESPAAEGQVFLATPADPVFDEVIAHDWLTRQRARFAGWQPALEARLIENFALAEHLGKPMYMLSTGSRRKLGLVAAAASGAALTLLDQPYAALDARSARVLNELLSAQAGAAAERAWVVADYALPAALAGLPELALIELGD